MTQPLQLQYADAPARSGITYGQTPDGFLITIEIPLWRRLLLAAVGLPIIVGLVTNWVFGVAALIVIVIVGFVRKTFLRPVIIELVGEDFFIRNWNPSKPDYFARRSEVYSFRYVSHSGNIVVHAKDHEMFEFRPLTDARLLAWLAETVQKHLAAIPAVTINAARQ